MKNVAVLKDHESYPDIKSVDPELQAHDSTFAFYQFGKIGQSKIGKYIFVLQQSRWNVLPKAILNCDAYWELSNAAKAILLRALAELRFKEVPKGSKRGKSLFGGLERDGYFCLPYGMLMAAGIGTKPTIAKALKELKESGWIVQVNQRSLFRLSTYRLGPDVLNEKIIKRRPKVTCKQS